MKKSLIFGTVALLASTLCAENHILIDKSSLRLYVITEKNDTIDSFPISAGRNYGQKLRSGDNRTPEGKFTIVSIEKSSGWQHTTSADDGSRVSVYGPWFLRLSCPQSRHIGIHGTYSEKTIGSRESEGCVRMHCADVEKLKEKYAFRGMTVIITPDTIAGNIYTSTPDSTAVVKSTPKRRFSKSRRYSPKGQYGTTVKSGKVSKYGIKKRSGKRLRRRR